MEFESYIERAREAKKSFESLLAKGLERDAMSRGYYTAFYLALALFLKNNKSLPKTHSGLVAQMWEMKEEMGLDKKLVQDFSKLQAVREKSDYSPVFFVGKDDIKRTKDVIAKLSKMVGL